MKSIITVGVLVLGMMVGPLTGVTSAATVTLANGDRVSGKIVSLLDGKLLVQTAYAEKPLEFVWQDVALLESDTELRVVLDSGEILRGKVSSDDDTGRLRVERPEMVAGKIPYEAVSAINPPEKNLVRLKGNISLAGNYQTGNTDKSGISVSLDGVRKDQSHRFTLGLLYNYAEEDDTISARSSFGRLKYDYFFTEHVYGYLNIEMLYDKFKDLNLRVVVGPGAGYQVWDEEKSALAFEVGVAYYNEDREFGEDDSYVTARLAALFRYAFSSGLEFSENFSYYPSLENLDIYTIRNEAALTAPAAFGWALQLKNILDYESEPASAETKKTDSTWLLGLNYAF